MMATWPEEARKRSRIADKNDTEITLKKALGMWESFCLNFSPCTLSMHRWGTAFPSALVLGYYATSGISPAVLEWRNW